MNINKLIGIVPDLVIKELPSVIGKFQIDTPLRLSHFLGQCSHESGGFNTVRENLNYSTEGLLKIFPKYFDPKIAMLYHRNPSKIASLVYANRMGNGPENTGDGYRHRGRGYIQLTGKDNYAAFDKVAPGVLADPDLVATNYPLLSAGWFWDKNKLNAIADKGIASFIIDPVKGTTVIERLTEKINGGLNGLPHRIIEFGKFYNLLKG